MRLSLPFGWMLISMVVSSDGFALNLGQTPDWEPSRMQDAYTAAAGLSFSFKLFLSFDMSVGES